MRIVHADFGAVAAGTAAETMVLVSASVAPLHAQPMASSEQVSQSVAGHIATILKSRDGWRRVRLADGYEGWMHEGYLETHALTPDAAAAWRSHARCSLGCTILDARTQRERALPLGARIARDVKLVSGAARDELEICRLYPPAGIGICASAARFYGSASYQWGGITPWGADCSGMVQAVFGLHGVALPRDARQQAGLGSAIGLTSDAWRAGDLLFFSDRADSLISHVAIVAQQHTLMHVAIGRGGFAVEHLEATTDVYTTALMGRLRSARRVL